MRVEDTINEIEFAIETIKTGFIVSMKEAGIKEHYHFEKLEDAFGFIACEWHQDKGMDTNTDVKININGLT